MKPRIFVSSTFYDLKYVREDLARFIRAHDFDPIMFEEGDIGYDPGSPLDKSCYESMKNADMAILIIGGQYGSAASEQNTNNVDEFISITHKEFKSAVDAGVPVFAFVDDKVHAEYAVYKNNIQTLRENPNSIKFSYTKENRIFEFIHNIYALGTIPINEFSRISDIKDMLAKQWSDMFKKYLDRKREEKEIESIKSSVSKLESLVNQMAVMVDAIGKNVLNEESNEYKNTKHKQQALIICSKIASILDLHDDLDGDIEARSDSIIEMLFEMNKTINRIKKDCISNNIEFRYTGENHSEFIEIWNIAEKHGFKAGISVNSLLSSINKICAELNIEEVREAVKQEIVNGYYYEICNLPSE